MVCGRRIALIGSITALAAVLAPAAWGAPPAGPTGIALDGRVELAWQPEAGATAYNVYRGTTPGSIATLITPVGGTVGLGFSDTGAVNGTTYYYAVRSIVAGAESGDSAVVEATPVARTCSAGNPVVLENCFPGTPVWNVTGSVPFSSGGIEVFATETSIDRSGAVALKARTAAATTMRVEIYRSGWYGGAGARLVSRVRGLPVGPQPACLRDTQTGLYDCAGWAPSGTITLTPAWPGGIYLIRVVRDDNGADWQTVLVVRDDSRSAQLLYTLPDTTYQAYNNYGGRSLYGFNSTGAPTVSGTTRAVKVSFDRPYVQPGDSRILDWYSRSDFPLVSWLERSGYDVNYQSDLDLDRDPARVRAHRAVVLGAHDEYYSAAMRAALEQGRDAGTSIFSSGANQVFWKIRFESSPVSGVARRTEVSYKTSEGGAEDPVTPTRRFRDPVAPNQPENALLGSMYIGDNSTASFPLVVPAAAGTDRIWRYTGLETQAPGTSTSIGSGLVAWEWDGRVDNGLEPAGVKTLASSPVTGHLLQSNGAYVDGPAVSTATKYTAPSFALVFQAGTNRWAWGLGRNGDGLGEPDRRIQQATTNILADMGVQPETPAAEITLDSATAPRVISATPADGQGGVALTTSVTAAFSRPMDPATITSATFTLRRPDGTVVPAAVAYDALNATATLRPAAALANATTYTARVEVAVQATDGTPLQSPLAWVFTTIGTGTTKRINAGGGAFTTAGGVVFDADGSVNGGSVFTSSAAIAGTSDDGLYQNERWGQFSYAIPVQNATYDVRLHFVELYYATPCAGKRVFGLDVADTPGVDLSGLDVCAQAGGANTALVRTLAGITVTDGVLNLSSVYGTADDPELAAIEVVPSALPPGTPAVSSSSPADGATGVAASTAVRATFSTAMDATTLTGSTFVLERAGAAVAATVTYDATTRTATLAPAAALAGGATYTARVTTGAKSSTGVPLPSPVSWSFTVAVPPVVGAVRINAGGGAFTTADGRSFAADASFLGGGIYTSGVAIAGTTDDALYQNERWGQFSYAIPVANGNYDLRLHFVELYYTGNCAGQRRFSIDVADTAGVDVADLDICAQAGGAATALVRSVPVSVADGVLNLTSAYGAADDPELAAIEILPAGGTPPPPSAPTVVARTPADGATGVATAIRPTATFSKAMNAATITATSFTLTPLAGGAAVAAAVAYDAATLTATLTPAAALSPATAYTARLATSIQAGDGTSLAAPVTWTFTTAAAGGGAGSTVRLNAGGGAFTTGAGAVFAADGSFSGGSTYSTTRPIAGTTDDALYQNERWGQFSYAIPVANGTYDVRLHFVEIYYGSAAPGGTGKRVFSIDLADTAGVDVANLDIYREVGADAALVKTVSGVQVTDGALNLQSIYGAADDPELAAVEVIATGGTTPPPPGPEQVGAWREPTSWPHVAVHLSMLPNGDILSFDGFDAAPNSQQIWKPSADTFTAVPYARNLFCSAHTLLPDGRTFLAGGHVKAYEGLADATIFDATTNTWSRAPDMAVPRWYPTATTLADGRVLVFSGDNIVQDRPGGVPPPLSDASVDSLPEVYDPQSNSWQALSGARLTSPLYPFLFVLTNGRILNAGPDTVTRTLDPALWTWSTVGTSPFDGMSAVLYRPDKVMKSGSWADPDFAGARLYGAHGRTAVLDMGAASPAWRETAPMSYPRAYHSLTLLPDGTVLASGGGTVSDGVDLTKSVLPAEIWNPDTETWTTVSPLRTGRLYHSTAILLADGRVLMAGGGQLPGSTATNLTTAEVFSPPYLFKGPRPVVGSAPATIAYGGSFTVSTPDVARIASVSLIRTPSVTHALDMNQRFLRLSFTKESGSLTVTAPAGGGAAPPGYYMLFLVDTNGVPSVASFVRLPAPWEAAPPPPPPPPPPSGDTTSPSVSVTAPAAGASVSGAVAVTATAADDVGVAGVQFRLDGAALGAEDTSAPYSVQWDAASATPGSHVLTAVARDAAGNQATSAPVTVTVTAVGTPPAGLVASYAFDAGSGTTAADGSGNGRTGTISGAAWSATGKHGGALSFDGVNDAVTVADAASLDLTTGMTISAWVNPSALGTAWRTAVLKENGAALVYALYAHTDANRPTAHVFTSGEIDTRGTGPVPVGAWTHLAATFDGAVLRLYVNGVQATSASAPGAMAASTGPLKIGGNSIWGEWFAGLIDDVRVYNRALTAAEIQTDMSTGV